jgi:hypothetical protein
MRFVTSGGDSDSKTIYYARRNSPITAMGISGFSFGIVRVPRAGKLARFEPSPYNSCGWWGTCILKGYLAKMQLETRRQLPVASRHAQY